ncbi:hypothetical protein DSL72_000822 [Monilinia vaccinii-corymbosi]|uniref:SET domain-containing protein n=1 Tax=Monilinia vaccinii-corymbosi TaxID=61207 RepID=A0A8A3P9S4_9HELO|nr:hypothetical protein DSL72_000822 [Monilinia vaccinii-corymbosi]
MSDLIAPPSQVEVNSTDTPPTSPCGHEDLMPRPPALVIRSSNPAKLKRKLALTFASLYDDEPTPSFKVKTEKTSLASPLWKNLKVEPKTDEGERVAKNGEVFKDPAPDHIELANGGLTKELTPPPEKNANSETFEKALEKVLPSASLPALGQVTESVSTNIDVAKGLQGEDSPSSATESTEKLTIRHEWTGTSQFDGITNISIGLQEKASIPRIIQALVHDVTLAPHDPSFYIDLSNLDAKLAFSDTSSHNAYRALLLLKSGLQTITPQQSELSRSVFTAVSARLCTNSVAIIMDELNSMHIRAYRCLVQGLLHSAAFWDGLMVVKLGLEIFPNDVELLDLRCLLCESFQDRHHSAMEDIKKGQAVDIMAATRPGLIYQKKYPWMAPKLFVRTPRLVRQVNSVFPSLNAEVRPVVFGPPGAASTFKPLSALLKTRDVGPLGIFAKRDIEEGESILADKSIACISDVSPSTGLFCDACHAALIPPFTHPSEIRRPSCGCKVSFCSKGCHDIAVGSYHKIQCGIDFGWLYNAGSLQTDWNPIMFLRVIGIVLSTPGWLKDSVPQKNPLLHPLVARMTANYISNNKEAGHSYDWSYEDNIVAPTRILIDLGIDIFSPVKKIHEGKTKLLANIWTPELIQTIYWRMSNNANTSTINIAGLLRGRSPAPASQSSGLALSSFGQNQKAHLIVLSPCYLFFNHSCRKNVSWMGTVSDGTDDISWLVAGEGSHQELMKPGSSSVICRASRNIKAGEELTISYVGDPMGNYTQEEYFGNPKLAMGKSGNGDMSEARWAIRTSLTKWFSDGGGCGCEQCAEENQKEKIPERNRL